MNRLDEELQRLYGVLAREPSHEPSDAQGPAPVRAMVLELARPADWAPLGAMWNGVQADLALPAPAVAVNGGDGLQLWFSLREPVALSQAWAFLDALRRRYLVEIAPPRVALWPAWDAPGDGPSKGPSDVALAAILAAQPPQAALPLPAFQAENGRWSAFVSFDLAPLCADEPWLDVPPNPEGQAHLLASLKSISPEDFDLALQRLRSVAEPAARSPAALSPRAAVSPQAEAALDPKSFLQSVMNNESLDLALRVEAAKALLPYR